MTSVSSPVRPSRARSSTVVRKPSSSSLSSPRMSRAYPFLMRAVSSPRTEERTRGDTARAGDEAMDQGPDREQVRYGDVPVERGAGGETHQVADRERPSLTTQQGMPVADDQNTLRVGARGPSLLEDAHFREK